MAVWDRQPEETAKAYAAFCAFRDMGRERAVDGAYQRLEEGRGKTGVPRKAPSHWWEWYGDYSWKTRAEAYDGHLEQEARKQREADHLKGLQDYRDRQQKLAAANIEASINLLRKANARLASLDPSQIDVKDLPAFFRAAAAVAETSTNSEANALAVEELLKALDGSSDG